MAAAMVRLWPGVDERSCCSPGALQRARQVAAALGLPFRVLDRERGFDREVVEPFVRGYLAGETPNPCVVCNPRRLADLVALADELGLARVATGHYARLVWTDGEPYLARAADRAKDQTYMLWAVPTGVLARLEFPLGDLTKDQVRAAAVAADLPVATQAESQEVCFAADGYRRFLEARGVQPWRGRIVDENGHALGEHEGQWRYTIGQRRGLGVSARDPLFVVERRAASNEIVVGPRSALDVGRVAVSDVVDRELGDGSGLVVQLRYRSAPVAVAGLEWLSRDTAVVHLQETFNSPAVGQSAVFYREDVVVGGGVVARSGVGDRV